MHFTPFSSTYSTPTARVPSNSTLVTCAFSFTLRFGRWLRGFRNARAVVQRWPSLMETMHGVRTSTEKFHFRIWYPGVPRTLILLTRESKKGNDTNLIFHRQRCMYLSSPLLAILSIYFVIKHLKKSEPRRTVLNSVKSETLSSSGLRLMMIV